MLHKIKVTGYVRKYESGEKQYVDIQPFVSDCSSTDPKKLLPELVRFREFFEQMTLSEKATLRSEIVIDKIEGDTLSMFDDFLNPK